MNAFYDQAATGSSLTGSSLCNTSVMMVVGSVLLFIGTGGSLSVSTAQTYPAQIATASVTEITQAPPGEHASEEPAPAVQSLAERVGAIKAAFGLTISQLAKVLRVERQTIYDWMDEDHPPQLQEQKRERLAAIGHWAAQWNALCPWPAGKGITTYTVEGATLLDLLLTDVLDAARLTVVLHGLSEQVKAEWQQREERSRGEQARRRGLQPHGQSLRSVLAGYGGSVSFTHDDQ